MLTIRKPRRSIRDWVLSIISVLLLCTGGYILFQVAEPVIAPVDPANNSTTKLLTATKDQPQAARVYIPKIDINIPFQTDTGKGHKALSDGAWWRQPQNGNPVDGGNFILAAHRFDMGYLPGETKRKSPFYNIDRMRVGDPIIVDYKNKRYEYKIFEITRVKPDAVSIENRTKEPQLTVYTCTLGGESDGREVLLAKPVAEP